MTRQHSHLSILNKLLPKNRTVAMLSAQETSNIFLDLYDQWQASRISLEEFSRACGELWSGVAIQNHDTPDILWAELADALYSASELDFAAQKGEKQDSSLLDDINFFVANHKKVGKNQNTK